MDLPNLSAWNAGAEHDEEMFNAVSYALNFLLDPPECRVNQTSAQSIPTGTTTATAITWQSASVDNDGMFDVSNPSYITIQTPGWYEVEFAVAWATKTTDTTLRGHALHLNGLLTFGTGSIAYNEIVNDSTTTPQPSMQYDLFLNTGDTLHLGVIQASGASLNTASSSSLKDQQTFMRVRWASL